MKSEVAQSKDIEDHLQELFDEELWEVGLYLARANVAEGEGLSELSRRPEGLDRGGFLHCALGPGAQLLDTQGDQLAALQEYRYGALPQAHSRRGARR